MLDETTVSHPARQPASPRKAELLERVAAYLLDNGLEDLSLRPLASALGVSPRTLLYYFGSKERMLVDALDAARRQQQRQLVFAGAGGVAAGIHAYWRWAITPAGRAYLRLLYQVYAITLQDQERFNGFFMRESLDWLAFCTDGLRALGVADDQELASLATQLFAAVRGLELDLLATGDTDRLARALDAAITDITTRARRLAGHRQA